MNYRQRTIVYSVCCASPLIASVAFSSAVHAGGPNVKIDVGAYHSEGDYGLKDDTRISGVPLSIRYRGWPWKVKMSTMWVRLKGPGTLSDGDIGNDRDDVIRNEKGIGDTSLTLEREGVFGTPYDWYWNLGLRVKIPTGNEDKGLGTGEFDYEPRFTLMYLGWPVKPYLLTRYTFKGDNAEQDYENTLGATLGASYAISPSVNLGTQITARESSVENGNDRLEVLVNGDYRWSPQWKTGLYVIKGLKEGSPDWATGLTISYQWQL